MTLPTRTLKEIAREASLQAWGDWERQLPAQIPLWDFIADAVAIAVLTELWSGFWLTNTQYTHLRAEFDAPGAQPWTHVTMDAPGAQHKGAQDEEEDGLETARGSAVDGGPTAACVRARIIEQGREHDNHLFDTGERDAATLLEAAMLAAAREALTIARERIDAEDVSESEYDEGRIQALQILDSLTVALNESKG